MFAALMAYLIDDYRLLNDFLTELDFNYILVCLIKIVFIVFTVLSNLFYICFQML